MATERIETRCAIAGGGPAGMMLGLLLARAGIDVVVLEKHADFLRDFRGDTLHPSTLEVMAELGLLERLLQRPHQEWHRVRALVGGTWVTLADFRALKTRCRFIGMMPQWDFLDFLSREAGTLPTFHLRMSTEVEDLLEERRRVVGVVAKGPRGPVEVQADLVVAADGRASRVREVSGLRVKDLGAPIDVLWMRLPRRSTDPPEPFARIEPGRFFVMFDRTEYWQCAFVIAKGRNEEVRAAGLPRFRAMIAESVPWLSDRVGALRTWDDVKLLTVLVDRLERWYRSGLLCLGDAAHAMSPVGGVGINLAIQDAVAAANLLAGPLRRGPPSDRELAAVQKRREPPTAATQRLQVALQNRLISRVVSGGAGAKLPAPIRLLRAMPTLRFRLAKVLGLGLRPEHVRLPGVRVP